MKKIQTYKSFLESFNKDTAVMHEKSIYDFFEELKNYRWNDKFPASSISFWSDHFIGEGWFNKVKSHIDRIFDICQEVDLNHINDAMLEVFDTIPDEKERKVYTSVLYGDYKRVDDSNKYKFNGTMPLMMPFSDPLAVQKRKNGIILGILIDMINPTLHVWIGHRLPGTKGDTLLRDSKESRYVTDEKWQCQNIKFTDEIFKGRISEWAMKDYEKYSLDNILNLYRPGVVINIGGWGSESRYTGPMDLEKLESDIDEVIDLVTAELDYEDILWEYSRGERKFDTSQPIYDYEVKILLKM